MRVIEKTDCKLSVSNNSLNALSGYKIESIFLLMLDFAADFPLQLQIIYRRIGWLAINIGWKLKHFQNMYSLDSDYLTKLFFNLPVLQSNNALLCCDRKTTLLA